MHHGYSMGGYSNRRSSYETDEEKRRRQSWNEDDDRKWRATTQAPYFENKVPGSTSYLPAAAVVGEFLNFSVVIRVQSTFTHFI